MDQKNDRRRAQSGINWPIDCHVPDPPGERMTVGDAFQCGLIIGAMFAIAGCVIYIICVT